MRASIHSNDAPTTYFLIFISLVVWQGLFVLLTGCFAEQKVCGSPDPHDKLTKQCSFSVTSDVTCDSLLNKCMCNLCYCGFQVKDELFRIIKVSYLSCSVQCIH